MLDTRGLIRRAVCVILLLSLWGVCLDVGSAEPPAAPGEATLEDAPDLGALQEPLSDRSRESSGANAEEPELTPRQRRNRRHQEFAGQWNPFFLYYSDYALFSPFSLDALYTFPEEVELVALATTPAQSTVVYCIEQEEESSIFLLRLEEDDSLRQIVNSADLRPGLVFPGPASLSRDKRWLLIGAVQHTPQSTGEVWLIDLTGGRSPECILAGTELVGCSWSPVGTAAACLTRQAGGESAVVFVDPDGRTTETLVSGEGRIEWSLDGSRLSVHLATGDVVTVDVASKRKESSSSGSAPASSGVGECSDGSSVVARVERTELGDAIRIEPRSGVGGGRVAPVPFGVMRLLGWSDDGKLLAYVGNDGTLHFCSGVVSDVGYERLMRAYPPTPGGVDPEQLIQSARDGMALQTRISPIGIQSPDDMLWGWAQSSIGPSFVYGDKIGQTWQLRAVQFRAMSVPDLGLDPEADYATQLFELSGLGNMESVAQALNAYARDHEGTLPSHSGGANLENDLAPYLPYIGCLHAIFSPGQVNVRLFVPGESTRGLAESVSGNPGRRIRIAETLPEKDRVFAIDAVLLEGYAPLGPDSLSFPYEVTMEYR